MNELIRKRFISLILIVAVILSLAPIGAYSATVPANPTSSSVLVNGSKVAFEAYNISNNNYFKLRDIGMALNGSGKQFQISWDGTKNAVNIITNQPYTAVGGELSISGNTSVKNALLSTSKVYINGKEALLSAYNIGGNNYFKLRDLGEALNFGVAWDSTANSIIVDTSMDYKAGAAIVTMSGFKFLPGVITINKGDTVIWKNNDSAGHDVSGDGFVSPIFGKGETFIFTFNTAGTFDYSCIVHPGMTGKVVVK